MVRTRVLMVDEERRLLPREREREELLLVVWMVGNSLRRLRLRLRLRPRRRSRDGGGARFWRGLVSGAFDGIVMLMMCWLLELS